jgi:hypothetical protein
MPDGRPPARDRGGRRRGRSRGWLVLAWIVALAVAAPVAVLAGGRQAPDAGTVRLQAPRPGESCPDSTPEPGSSDVCQDALPPDVTIGGIDLGGVLPILAAVVVGGLLALVAAFFVLTRRPSGPLAPTDPSEWWTCRSCGKTNVVGSPRCYACGTWQG